MGASLVLLLPLLYLHSVKCGFRTESNKVGNSGRGGKEVAVGIRGQTLVLPPLAGPIGRKYAYPRTSLLFIILYPVRFT